jgi:hypothetical protein
MPSGEASASPESDMRKEADASTEGSREAGSLAEFLNRKGIPYQHERKPEAHDNMIQDVIYQSC